MYQDTKIVPVYNVTGSKGLLITLRNEIKAADRCRGICGYYPLNGDTLKIDSIKEDSIQKLIKRYPKLRFEKVGTVERSNF